MRTGRLHLVGVLLALVGFATSMPQPPYRHHGGALRNVSPVQLDDDDQREGEAAILEDEAAPGGAGGKDRRRRA